MDKQAVIRRVRIAVSVFFAIVAAWLCVMWVRSIYTIDQFIAPVSSAKYATFATLPHRLCLGVIDDSPTKSWALLRVPVDKWIANIQLFTGAPPAELSKWFSATSGEVIFPIWCAVAGTVIAAVAPWVSYFRRFSLRTMLIATTLVAIVLGLGVWLAS